MKPILVPGPVLRIQDQKKAEVSSSLHEFKAAFQPYLERFIDGKTESYSRYIQDPQLVSIWSYPRRLAAQGKRVRPYVAYLMYNALHRSSEKAEGDDADVLPILVSLELFHLFCLIHDDIIDRGTERHNLPTVQKMVAEQMDAGNGLHERSHIGNAQALLLGDVLFSWAQEAFHGNRDFPIEIQQQAQKYFNTMIDEVVLGEMLDVDMMTRRQTTQASIEKKMFLKTAAYTFMRPMQIGAALAGTGSTYEAYCAQLGFALGVAFQIQDDLLDIVGTPETTHKTLFADLRDHQHTYFTQFIFQFGTLAEKSRLRELLGADLGREDQIRVLELFETSGALEHGRQRIRRHLDEACALVDRAPFDNQYKEPFFELVATMQHRIPANTTTIGIEHELVA